MGSVATSQLTSILGNSWPAWLTMDRIWPGNFGSPTLPETNISSENQWLEDDSFPFGMAYFQRANCYIQGEYSYWLDDLDILGMN